MRDEKTETLIQRNLKFSLTPSGEKRIDSDCYVEGYATTFDKYCLIERKGKKIYEQVDRNAFDDSDMTDVIFQFDHAGPVFARTTNGTLGLEVDDRGLFVWADLSKTSRAREMYEDIKAGNVTQMSIRCRAKTSFDGDTQTIRRIGKVVDVSAVSIPANDHTAIVARNADNYERERKRELLALKLKVEE